MVYSIGRGVDWAAKINQLQKRKNKEVMKMRGFVAKFMTLSIFCVTGVFRALDREPKATFQKEQEPATT